MTTPAHTAPTMIAIAWDEDKVMSDVEAAIAAGYSGVKKSSMKLGPYNGFSGDMRLVADYKIKVAIKLGLVPVPTQCTICGTSEGRIDYHAEDYGRPLRVAAICMRCHMRLHNRHRSAGYALSWRKLVAEHATGQGWFEQLN